MPVVRYFVIVGGMLLGLLFFADWYFPTSTAATAGADTDVDRSIIRIHSLHKWPAAIRMDTKRADAHTCSCHRGGHGARCTDRAREAGLRLRAAPAKGARKASPPRQTFAAAVARPRPARRQLSTAGFARLAARGLVSEERLPRSVFVASIAPTNAPRHRRWGNWPRHRAVSSIPVSFAHDLRANATRLSRRKTASHSSGSCVSPTPSRPRCGSGRNGSWRRASA